MSIDYLGAIVTAIAAIDLREFSSGEPARQRLAKRVDRICREIGFLAVTGHGVDPCVIGRAWDAARDFFDSASANKHSVAPPHAGYPHGYFAPDFEALAGSRGEVSPPDLKESFNIGPPERPPVLGDDPDLEFYFAPNLWPADPAGLRDAWHDYYRAMNALAATLMRLFAIALGLPEDYFDSRIDRAISAMRALNYPPVNAPVRPGQLRAGAHTDYGSLTILLTDPDTPGLEVRSPGRGWLPVSSPPDSFIVNLGDLMARWTNDRWVSTLHRVANPPPGSADRRQSIAFFHQPNFDAEITCIPTCLAPGERPKYPSVYSGPYLMERYRGATAVTGT